MQIIEQYVLGKSGDPELCEDAVVVTGGFAAVVDGATDISGRRYDGVAGGRWAMAACVDAIRGFAPGIDAGEAVRALTAELASRVDPGLPAAERPSASVTVFSAARREVWQVGDVGYRYPGLPAGAGQPRKLIDEIAAAFRSAVVAAAAAGGEITLADDPGRAAVRALVGRQGNLRNTVGRYGYAGIDGSPVPQQLVVICALPEEATELVIASDGYPVIGETLADSEAALADLLERDPWCVAELAGTKGVLVGQVSFDDRAYLRLRI